MDARAASSRFTLLEHLWCRSNVRVVHLATSGTVEAGVLVASRRFVDRSIGGRSDTQSPAGPLSPGVSMQASPGGGGGASGVPGAIPGVGASAGVAGGPGPDGLDDPCVPPFPDSVLSRRLLTAPGVGGAAGAVDHVNPFGLTCNGLKGLDLRSLLRGRYGWL